MNKLRKLCFIGIFALVFIPLSFAQAADGSRYFVRSSSQFWKNAFNARHEFKDGFTADLNDWQFRFGKLLGINIEPVPILQVLPVPPVFQQGGSEDTKETKNIKGKPGSATRYLPSDQTPWGIEYIYKDSNILSTSGGEGVNVAVLDTGITVSHPDLKNRVAKCKDFTNIRFPVVDGKCDDKNGHGTHVAGIIAADGGGDNLGIFGVAPQASLYAFKVCSTAGCYADDIAIALESAVNEGAHIINLSLGADQQSSLIKNSIDYAARKGTLVIAAGGNDGPYFASIDYPAAQSNVAAVGAFGLDFEIPDWSSRGINSKTTPFIVEEQDMEFAAPGVNIESTWKSGGYAILSGTSMASPFVAGLAAKYWPLLALDPNPAESVRNILHTNSLDIDGLGDDDATGFGFPRIQ